MPTQVSTIEDYIKQTPADRQEALKRIRHLIRAELAGSEERVEDGKITYSLEGEAKAAFASQEHHIAFFVYEPAVFEAHKAKFNAPHEQMMQFNKAEAVDYDRIATILHDIAEANR